MGQEQEIIISENRARPGKTAKQAFDEYRRGFVDLDPEETGKARKSRDYLKGQLFKLAEQDTQYPVLPSDLSFQDFGSFARRTKTRPLDDIDVIEFLNDCSGLYWERTFSDPYLFRVRVATSHSIYWRYTEDDGYLNSTRILNRLKKQLEAVENYQKADIKRNGVAIILNLSSYDWVFDIVPGFRLLDEFGRQIRERLIPNGKGQWMLSQPQHDQDRVSFVNQEHDNKLIPIIRLLKFWNVNTRYARRVNSYHLETMLIDGFEHDLVAIGSIRRAIPRAFSILSDSIWRGCADPKGLSPNLDSDWTIEERSTLSEAASTMAARAQEALDHEDQGDHKTAINWWKSVFPDFPDSE